MDVLGSTSKTSMSFSKDSTTAFRLDTLTFIDKPQYLLVSQSQYFYIMRFLLTIQFAITFSGIVSNTLCIRTFLRIGLKECVTITFFNQAISDLGFLVINSLHCIATVFYITQVPVILGVETESFVFFVNLSREFFFFASSYFIPFLAVQRSLCVLLPLRFKGMFTRNRTFIILSVIWGYSLLCRSMEFSIYGLSRQWSDTTNTSIWALHFPRPGLLKYVRKWTNIMNNIILFILSNAVIVGSLFILTYALKKSVRFRAKMSTSSHKDSGRKRDVKEVKGGDPGGTSKSSSSSATSSSKERQAIVQVGILSVLYLLAFLPIGVKFILRYAIPWLFVMEYYFFLWLYIETYMTFMMANASINFLVYYRYNTAFKEHCFKSILK